MNRRSSVLALFLAISGLALSACEFKVSTANISDAKLARSLDENKEAVDPTTTFSTADKEIFAVVDLANAPEDTDVLGIWRHTGTTEEIRSAVKAGGDMNKVNFSLKTPNGLPAGQYVCDIYINRSATDTTGKPDKSLEFTVQ